MIVKHANPCGVAVGDDITDAYVKANACDPVSAFGGIVALNRSVPAALADALAAVFTEVIVAPSFDDDALAILDREEEPAGAHRPAAVRRRARHPLDRRRSARARRRHGQPRSVDVAGGHQGRANRRAVGRPARSRGRSAPRSAATPSSTPRIARRSASVPASRTVSTRHASPPSDQPGGPTAACARAMRSSRSATVSMRQRLPAFAR